MLSHTYSGGYVLGACAAGANGYCRVTRSNPTTARAKRHQERPKDLLRVRDMLSDPTSTRSGVLELRGQEKGYDPIIDEIQTMSWPYPASKVL